MTALPRPLIGPLRLLPSTLHSSSTIFPGLLLSLFLLSPGCAITPPSSKAGEPAALQSTAREVQAYTSQVRQDAQAILTDAQAAAASLRAAPPDVIRQTIPHVDAIQTRAAQLRDTSSARQADFKLKFAQALSDLLATIRQRDAAATQADALKLKLGSEVHRRIVGLIILLVLAGAAAVGLGGYLLFTGSLTVGAAAITAGLSLWGLASLLGFYDRHQRAFELAGLLGVAALVAWLVVSHIGFQQLKQDAASFLSALETKGGSALSGLETQAASLKSRLLRTTPTLSASTSSPTPAAPTPPALAQPTA